MTGRQIQVRNLPRNVSEDLLSNFFENPRIFGKDIEVKNVIIRGGNASVEFKEDSHVDHVLEVHAKSPCKLSGCKLDITLGAQTGHPSTKPHPAYEDNAPDDHESSTIEVQDLHDSVTDELLHNYFENPIRAGGGPIVDVKRMGTTAYIKYQNKDDAHNVLKKTHCLCKHEVRVKLLVINRQSLLLSNLPPGVSEETLTNYLEAKLRVEVQSITFNQEQTKALVDFRNDIDFQSAQSVLCQAPVQGVNLGLQEVPVSGSIMVINMADTETSDSVMFYFENKNKSNGGQVEKVEMCEDDGFCLVHFVDPDVVKSVCNQDVHMLSGTQLKVQSYNRLLGVPFGAAQLKFKLPNSIQISQKETHIFTVLGKRNRENIDQKFKSAQAKINWNSNPLQITCTITEEDKDCRSLARTWKKHVSTAVEGFTGDIEVRTFSLSVPVWTEAKKQLQNLNVKHPDKTVLNHENDELVIVAPKQDMAEIKDNIKKAIEKGEAIIKRQNERTTEEVDLKMSWKVNYLRHVGISTTVDDEIQLNVNTDSMMAVFTGPKDKITEAKLHMYDVLNQIKSKTLLCEPGQVRLLKNREISDKVKGRIAEVGGRGVFEIMGTTIIVHGKDEQSQQQIEDILNQTLVNVERRLNRNSMKTFQSSKWDQFKRELSEAYNSCIEFELCEDDHILKVFTLDDYKDEVLIKVQAFLDKNTTMEDTVVFKDEDAVKFVERFQQDEIRQAVEKCRCEMKYKFVHTKLILNGTEEDIEMLSSFFKKLVSGVKTKILTKQMIGIQKYLACPAGKECIEKLEASFNCTIRVVSGECRTQSGDGGGHRGSGHSSSGHSGSGHNGSGHRGSGQDTRSFDTHQRLAQVMLNGNVKLTVESGDLTNQSRDVIVITASKTLQFRGRLYDTITEKGGQQIAEDCRSRIDDRGALLNGEVYLSIAGSLPCKAIAHAVIGSWGQDRETGSLKLAVENCLKKCDKKGYQSIVIPGLGTGNLHYPTKIACKTIVRTIKAYFDQVSQTSIQEVVLCDMNKETLQMFAKCLDSQDDPAATGDSEDYYIYRDRRRSNSSEGIKGRRRRDSSDGIRDRRHHSFSDDEDEQPQRRPRSHPGIRVGRTQITVVVGHLSNEQVDVIVDSAPSDLILKKGRCSGALLEAAGYRIQQECSGNYPDGIEPGEVATTTGGKLKCQEIYHIALMPYNREGYKKAVKGLHASLEKCLQMADARGHSSIAILSLGTGSMKYPGDVVASEMFSCVTRYLKNNPRSSLSKVRLVIFPRDGEAKEAFQAVERKLTGRRESSSEDVEVVLSGSGSHGNSEQLEVTIHGVKVILVKAYLSKEKGDVIVNSTAQDLKLDKGQASKALLKAAGPTLQLECQQNFSGGITVGQVAVTSPGNLNCQKVFHIAVPAFEKDNGETSMQGLCSCVSQCLVTANQMGFKTISIPPIGTGYQKYPKGWVAAKVLSSIDSFFQQNPKSSLTTIRLVIYPDDDAVYLAYKKELSKRGPVTKQHTGEKTQGASRHGNKSASFQMFMAKEKNECVLKICSDSTRNIDEAKCSFDTTVEREWCVKKFKDEALSTLRHDKVKAIKEELQKHSVHAHIDVEGGCISAYGLARNLLDISDVLDDILKKQHKYLSTKKEAVLMKNMVQWFYIVNQKTIPFSDIDSLKVEKAYKNKDATFKVQNRAGQTFIIDFQKMHSYEMSSPSQTTAVVRRDVMADTSGTVPTSWTVPKGSSPDAVTLVPLSVGSPEYTQVLGEFQKSLGRAPNIIKIERVQNKTLYIQYAAKLRSINLQNNSKNNVKVLWHGTAPNIVPSIYTHGFNRSFCNSCSIGNGVYFAVNARYSDGGYARPDASGHKRMFRCLVITGQSCQGQGGMRVPPTRTTTGNTPILYDSVTDSPRSPGMFVIFHDCQAYPEHLITYT